MKRKTWCQCTLYKMKREGRKMKMEDLVPVYALWNEERGKEDEKGRLGASVIALRNEERGK